MSAGLFAEPRGRAWRIVDADMIEVFRDVEFISKKAAVAVIRAILTDRWACGQEPRTRVYNRKKPVALVPPVSSSVPQCLRKVGFETPSTRAMSASGMP